MEAFRDQQAGVEHVTSLNFRAGLTAMRPALTHTPQIIHTNIDAHPAVGLAQMRSAGAFSRSANIIASCVDVAPSGSARGPAALVDNACRMQGGGA